MSEEVKPTPSADQQASAGLQKVDAETELATNPKSEESLEKPKSNTYTDMASEAASNATATATSMKDNVFSMFGGGPKKEKKQEEEEADEPSGSSKVKKNPDEEEVSTVRPLCPSLSLQRSWRCRRSHK